MLTPMLSTKAPQLMPRMEMLDAAQGQARSKGRPLRSASSMTLMPLVSMRPTAVVGSRWVSVIHALLS